MKNRLFYLVGIFFIVACNSNSNNEDKTSSDLPEGKWNGEYMEVDSQEEKDTKRPTKKSNGGEILNLGKVIFKLGNKEMKIVQFDRRKNDITINKGQIAIRIKDANDHHFIIEIHKNLIYKNPEGNYIDIRRIKGDNAPKFSLSYTSDLHDKNQTYQCVKGSLIVKKMNLRSGEVLIEASGDLQNMESLKEGTPQPFEIEIKMNFETVVSTFDPSA